MHESFAFRTFRPKERGRDIKKRGFAPLKLPLINGLCFEVTVVDLNYLWEGRAF